MFMELSFTCPLINGIHARPASGLEEVARQFASSIRLCNQRNGVEADAKSVLLLVGADVRQGDSCRMTFEGPDAHAALTAVSFFIDTGLPACDEPLPEAPVFTNPETVLPLSLRNAGVSYVAGTPIGTGIGKGTAVFLEEPSLPCEPEDAESRDADVEWNEFRESLSWLRDCIADKLRGLPPSAQSAILKAHLSIVRDPALLEEARMLIFGTGRSASRAASEVCEHFARSMREAESPYIRGRALDMHDICAQLVARIRGDAPSSGRIVLPGPSVVFAETLAPSLLMALQGPYLRGLVLGEVGATSHTAILARSFGIPTLADVNNVRIAAPAGREVVVDAARGILFPDLSPIVQRYFVLEETKHRLRARMLARIADLPAATRDGARIEIGANIAFPTEVQGAFACGAEGIGLYRTEMLFMDRESPPSEEEQLAAYRNVLETAGNRPVIIRTLDIGGDKPLPYLSLPAEKNPFLGYRGVRMYEKHAELIAAQLRAIVRASAHGKARILIPMVSNRAEILFVKSMLADIRANLTENRVPFDASINLGIMVETPAAALAIGSFCSDVQFFSIGTNDLSQYFFAADRQNARVAHLNNCSDPSFVHLLRSIVHQAHARGKWVGMCGEMAADPRNLPLLVGLGLDEVSVAPSGIADAKYALSRLSAGECRELADAVIRCDSAENSEGLLSGFQPSSREAPLIDENLILTDAPSTTREEAIKELSDALFAVGRTGRPADLEEAIWQRELVYSTGLGYGFAIPHCKSAHVLVDTIAVLKPKTPIGWNSLDEKPVTVVILLAIRESAAKETHLKVFASLARKVMHADFRDFITREDSPGRIREFLEATLHLDDVCA